MGIEFENQKQEASQFVNQKVIDKAYEKALKVLSQPIDPEDFKDIYRDVEKDIAFVERMERKFAEEAAGGSLEKQNRMKIAKIFEAIIFQHAEQSNWFGDTATTIEASRFDDIVNKVDTIVEFGESESRATHLALAMDVTTASRFSEKFEHIKKSIERGELTKVKYFISEILDIRGEKSNIPHVVIGVDRKTTFDVIEAWNRGDNKKLANHPVQIKILAEIQIQLKAFKQYAEKLGKDDVVRVYEKTLRIIESIMSVKEIDEKDLAEAEKDEYFSAIKQNAEDIAMGITPSGMTAID
ncbi:MAG: hypothetical protein WC735_02415 [Candidatus Paceibacterota bacterium]|jgi:hypothetical protein